MKKQTHLLKQLAPTSIMKPYVVVAFVAYILNALFWTLLLVNVYADGFRMSQFSIMVLSQVLLPVVFFTAINLTLLRQMAVRLHRHFYASVGATITVLVSSIVSYGLYLSPASFTLQRALGYSPTAYGASEVLATLVVLSGLGGYMYVLRRKIALEAVFVRMLLAFSVTFALANIAASALSGRTPEGAVELALTLLLFTGIALLAFRKRTSVKKWSAVTISVVMGFLLMQALQSAVSIPPIVARYGFDIPSYDLGDIASVVGGVILYSLLMLWYVRRHTK